MPDSAATRLLGGTPLTVLVRLVVVSLIVGALMSWLGLDAFDILAMGERAFEHLYGTGFAALNGVGRTVVAGAVLVVPVWIVLRVMSYRGPPPRLPDDGRQAPSRWSNPERVRD